jgi:hypothetical protein
MFLYPFASQLKVKRLGDMGTYFLSAALLSSQTVALHTLWLTSCNIGTWYTTLECTCQTYFTLFVSPTH